MISSQTIIERSVYSAILETLVSTGYSLRPDDYFPISTENSKRFNQDKTNIQSEKGRFISVFGIGNNQSRGIKECPRITIEAKGFMPGDIGLPKSIIDKVEDSYFVSEFPYEAIDQYIDIHLVANNQEDMRLLHTMLFASIPQRGYIKPYNLESIPFDGNIYIEISNFYDLPDTDKGIMEKVYEFTVKDSILENLVQTDSENPIVPINYMEILLTEDQKAYTGKKQPPTFRGKDEKLLKSKTYFKNFLNLIRKHK